MTFPFDQELVLENDTVILRPLIPMDVENLLLVATEDKNLLQYSPLPIYTKALLEQYIQRNINYRPQRAGYSFSVFDKRCGAYAGSTSFLNISEKDDRLEIGSTWYGKKSFREQASINSANIYCCNLPLSA